MSEREEQERQTEQENQRYPDHGRPDRQREKVGLPQEEEKRAPNERE